MAGLGTALVPAFAAGFAVQQLLELLDPVLNLLPKNAKKAVLNLMALGIGLFLAIQTPIRVLKPLGLDVDVNLDRFVTALVLSAGTQGFNSIQKYVGAAKESKKADAETKRAQANLTATEGAAKVASIDHI